MIAATVSFELLYHDHEYIPPDIRPDAGDISLPGRLGFEVAANISIGGEQLRRKKCGIAV